MPPKYPFSAARDKINNDIVAVRAKLSTLDSSKKLPNEAILCFRVRPEFVAKSYYPKELFNPAKAASELKEIGSRMYRTDFEVNSNQDSPASGKIFFVRATELGLDEFERKLNKRPDVLSDTFRWEIQRLVSLDLLANDEQLLGFDDWEGGRLEAALHPFSVDRSLAIPQFKKLVTTYGVDWSSVRIKQYGSEGLTFISLPGNPEVVKAMSGYNPLRTVHPLSCRSFALEMRSDISVGSPTLPVFTQKNRPVIGVIDGGYIAGNSGLDNYVDYVDYVGKLPVTGGPEHGTAVTSAILYGALNEVRNTDQLSEPTVTVRNFKVLSQDSHDPDLYQVIDAIESIVPANPDIQVYNLSLGPVGPILNDSISRFTYACDTLSKSHNVLFCSAIGNDGDKPGYDRIQSPSDMVNGLAVGAFSFENGKLVRAPYSCKGPGREGNKMKPDLVAFGGCDLTPIHLLTSKIGFRMYTSGTSFSTPLVSSAAARLISGSNNVINPLTGRVLLLHSADSSEKGHCNEMGRGFIPEDLEATMICLEKSYTLIYEGEVERFKYRKFDIPWIEGIDKGKAQFHWTVAALVPVDSCSPEDYTTASVEVNLCWNCNLYSFTKEVNGKNKTKRIDILKDAYSANELLQDGWKKSANAIGEGGVSPFASEADLKKELKWDSTDGRSINKMANGVINPSLYVHAIARGHRHNNEKIKFAIVLTVTASAAPFDIYPRVIAKYPALIPIKIQNEALVSVKV